jgi:hypothetical protein
VARPKRAELTTFWVVTMADYVFAEITPDKRPSVDRTDPLPDGQLGRSPETFDEMGTHAAVDESSNSAWLERTHKQIIGRFFLPVREWGLGD